MDRWVTYRQRLSAVNPPHQLNAVLVGVFNHTVLLKWSRLSFAWDVVSYVMLSDSDESEEEGGGLSLSSFEGFFIWGRSAGWPQSYLLMWMGVGASGWGGGGGVILNSHRFSLLYRVSSEPLTTEKRFASLDRPSSPFGTSETFTARPPLMSVGKTVT